MLVIHASQCLGEMGESRLLRMGTKEKWRHGGVSSRSDMWWAGRHLMLVASGAGGALSSAINTTLTVAGEFL